MTNGGFVGEREDEDPDPVPGGLDVPFGVRGRRGRDRGPVDLRDQLVSNRKTPTDSGRSLDLDSEVYGGEQ